MLFFEKLLDVLTAENQQLRSNGDLRDNFYHPEADGGISILDDTLGIDWKIPTEHANLSEKDTKHAMLKDFDSPFDINVDLYK